MSSHIATTEAAEDRVLEAAQHAVHVANLYVDGVKASIAWRRAADAGERPLRVAQLERVMRDTDQRWRDAAGLDANGRPRRPLPRSGLRPSPAGHFDDDPSPAAA